jgi:hypothetical protein
VLMYFDWEMGVSKVAHNCEGERPKGANIAERAAGASARAAST